MPSVNECPARRNGFPRIDGEPACHVLYRGLYKGLTVRPEWASPHRLHPFASPGFPCRVRASLAFHWQDIVQRVVRRRPPQLQSLEKHTACACNHISSVSRPSDRANLAQVRRVCKLPWTSYRRRATFCVLYSTQQYRGSPTIRARCKSTPIKVLRIVHGASP